MNNNLDDCFPPEEAKRRLQEILRNAFNITKDGKYKPGYKSIFDLQTGQNYEPPFLSAEELKRRGYP